MGPYKPRSGKIGASFRHYSEEQFQYVLKTARMALRGFGYDTETQNFPQNIPLPNRQVKPGKEGVESLELSADNYELRKSNDTFGRLSTWYRKSLLDPVIASDGTELNMDEVLAARQQKLQKESS